jgi:hypothetical protein
LTAKGVPKQKERPMQCTENDTLIQQTVPFATDATDRFVRIKQKAKGRLKVKPFFLFQKMSTSFDSQPCLQK